MQSADDVFSREHNQPRVRFTERGEPTIGFESLRSNPWASEWSCGRRDCVPCESRLKLAAEVEEASEKGSRSLPKKESSTIPDCTTESIGYTIECAECRTRGVIRRYIGETSRSGYTRGKEHWTAIENGEADHPMVKLTWEEHDGRKPEIVMRILTKHSNPLERMTTEAVEIQHLGKRPEAENLK